VSSERVYAIFAESSITYTEPFEFFHSSPLFAADCCFADVMPDYSIE